MHVAGAVTIHASVKNVMLADYVFTIPGLILLAVTGGLMAERAGYAMSGFHWLTLSLALFAMTGAIWAAVLLPLQRMLPVVILYLMIAQPV